MKFWKKLQFEAQKMQRIPQETTKRKITPAKDPSQEIKSSRYKILELVGKGSFGKVYKAEDKQDKRHPICAIKVIQMTLQHKNRELQVITTCKHFNTIQYRDHFESPIQGVPRYKSYNLNIVMPFMPKSLFDFLKAHRMKKIPVPQLAIKVISFQLFKVLDYFQSLRLCHRDMKPQNLLIDMDSYELKVCDFGSAKFLRNGEQNVTYICSRYYRAPELLLGLVSYGMEVDVWSVGCIIVQLMTIEPLFPGDSSFEQLIEIMKILGSPPDQLLKRCSINLTIPTIKHCGWRKILKRYNPSELFIDLVEKTLVFDPLKRIKPAQALTHPFFADLCTDQKYLEGIKKLPYLFDWSRNPKLQASGFKQILQIRFTNTNAKQENQTPPTDEQFTFCKKKQKADLVKTIIQ